jgi:putative endonuclease
MADSTEDSMIMDSKSEVGRQARDFGLMMERSARDWFLDREGGSCVAEGYRWRRGEIDLVFEVPGGSGTELVFVEVRARSGTLFSGAVGSLGPRKLGRVSRSIERFLARYRGNAGSIRFDVLLWEAGQWVHLRHLWPLP